MKTAQFSMVQAIPYAWPYNEQWCAADTALILVDLFSRIPEEDPLAVEVSAIREHLIPLLEKCTEKGIAVFLTQHPWYINGNVVQDTLPGMPVPVHLRAETITAKGTSAFYATDLHQRLQEMEITHLIFSGLPVETSLHSTMRDANDRGYECLLLEDGSLGSSPEDHEAIVRITQFGNGLFGTTATVDKLLTAIGEKNNELG